MSYRSKRHPERIVVFTRHWDTWIFYQPGINRLPIHRLLTTAMSLLTPRTQLDNDLLAIDFEIEKTAEAANHLAGVLQTTENRINAMPAASLAAMMNVDLQRTQAITEARSALGMAVNATLDLIGLDRWPARAPTILGRSDIAFDGQAFVVVEPPEAPEVP